MNLEEIMSCGHMRRYLVSADEGTIYCMECAWEAEIDCTTNLRAEIVEYRKALKYYQAGGGYGELARKLLARYPDTEEPRFIDYPGYAGDLPGEGSGDGKHHEG